MTFAEKLKGLRKSNGYSQVEFAKLIPISRSAVAKWETSRGLPDKANLDEIIHIFNLDKKYFC